MLKIKQNFNKLAKKFAVIKIEKYFQCLLGPISI